MKKDWSQQIAALEEQLRKEFQTDAVFPPGVPARVRLGMLEKMRADLKRTKGLPGSAVLPAMSPEMTVTREYCLCWCGGCGLRHWCETPDAYPSLAKWEENVRKMTEARKTRIGRASEAGEN